MTGESPLARHLPTIVAFAILAAYTYQSGLRAPALIAFVKDTLIYLVIVAALVYLPYRIGGWERVIEAAEAKFAASPHPGDGIVLTPSGHVQYVTLALGSALALFLYPHSLTGVLASRSRDVIKRNMAALPGYSAVLGLLALLGYVAIAAGVEPLPGARAGSVDSNTVVPLLFDQEFPDWFAGIAFAAIGIGALVPAAIMSIAAANLFTRNIYKEYLRPHATPAEETRVSQITSLVVKLGALACVVFLDPQFSIDLQLIGGVVILQTLPAVALGLVTRWFHRGALLAGWACGMGTGLWLLYLIPNPETGRAHVGGSAFPLDRFGLDTQASVYVGLLAVAVNLVVAVVLTVVLRAARVPDGGDRTAPGGLRRGRRHAARPTGFLRGRDHGAVRFVGLAAEWRVGCQVRIRASSTRPTTVPKSTMIARSTTCGSRRARRAPPYPPAMAAGMRTAVAAQLIGPNAAKTTTVVRPTTAESRFFRALTWARVASRTSPSAATSMTPSAAPK